MRDNSNELERVSAMRMIADVEKLMNRGAQGDLHDNFNGVHGSRADFAVSSKPTPAEQRLSDYMKALAAFPSSAEALTEAQIDAVKDFVEACQARFKEDHDELCGFMAQHLQEKFGFNM